MHYREQGFPPANWPCARRRTLFLWLLAVVFPGTGALAATNDTDLLGAFLRNPPSIEEAVFTMQDGSQYFRTAWSSNGFFRAFATNPEELQSPNYQVEMYGRAGSLVWRTSGGILLIADTQKESEERIREQFGDIRGWAKFAASPNSLGILPVSPGINELHFKGNTFWAIGALDKKVSGVIRDGEEDECLVEYTIEGIPDWHYTSHISMEPQANIEIPTWKYTEAKGPGQVVRSDEKSFKLIYCKSTTNVLPAEYFHPTNILKRSFVPLAVSALRGGRFTTYNDGKVVQGGGRFRRSGPAIAILGVLAIVAATIFKFRAQRSREGNESTSVKT